MADDFVIKQHDQLPELVATLTDAVDAVVDVSGSSVRFVLSVKGGENVLDEPADIVDGPTGVVKYVWQSGDTATVGRYNGEFEVEFGDGRVETFPNNKYIVIRVFADLGGVGV